MKKWMILVLALLSCSPSSRDQKKVPILPHQNIVLSPTIVENSGPTRLQLLFPLFHAMALQEEDALPFDEPRHEIGQQDGKLRPAWIQAYYRHQRLYSFNGDIYHTLGRFHQPLIPQVCADFIVDTINRAAGTWYSNDLKHPKLMVGKFDFRKQIEEEGFNSRSAGELIKFFSAHPDEFQILFEGTSDFEVGEITKLKTWLKAQHVQMGDIVIIRGRAPWDKGKEIHWHSFFISALDSDGAVSKLVGNAGLPREWSLEREVHRAPKRHVIAIIRLSNSFLKILY